MQEIHPVGAGGRGSLLGGGDSKLRPPHNRQQAIHCPRCDSVNTKFCYYNNYNLSQPRHFCKGCRRYWTKGGVLRNVPVGGGCRKPKRSKPNKSPTSTEDPDHHHRINSPPPNRHDNISHSTPQSSSSSRADAGDQSNPCGGVFQFEGIGVVTSLSSTSTTETPSSGCSRVDTGKLSEWQSKNQEWKMQGMVGEWVEDDCYLPWLQSGRSGGGSGGFGQLDWSDAGGEGGLFDLPSSAVDQACWSQSKWNYD